MTADKSNRNLKCKKWEKDRRGRLNDSFNNLAKVLPCYDPSVTISKIEILTKSAEYITKLKLKVDDCLTTDVENKPERAEIKELHVRVTNLTIRNEQLANLLKEANITIPSECGPLHIEKAKKWSGKITPEKADEINKLEAQKENKNTSENQENKKVCDKKIKPIKLPPNRKVIKKKIKVGKTFKKNATNKLQKVPILSTLPSIIGTTGTSNLTITNVQQVQPYYIIANNIPTTVTTQATTVVKNVISAPILSTTNQPNKTFTGGIILPVVQPQTLLNQPLILNAATPVNNTLIVVKTNKTDQNSIKTLTPTIQATKANKKYVSIKPATKRLPLLKQRRLLTKLVQGNKIGISASRYDSSFILWPNAPQQIVKKRSRVAKRKRTKPATISTEDEKHASAKKVKLNETDKKVQEVNLPEIAKKPNSDYSIDALCKESDGLKTNTDIEKAINDVVQGNSSKLDVIEKATTEEKQAVKAPPPPTTAPEIAVSVTQTQPNTQQSELPQISKPNSFITIANVYPTAQQGIQMIPVHFQSNQAKQQKQEQQLLPARNQLQLTRLNQDVQTVPPIPQLQKTKSLCQKVNNHVQQLHHNEHSQRHNHEQSVHSLQVQVQPAVQQQIQSQQNSEPIQTQDMQIHSELSNDIFASLQVQGSQNPESTSPTAAFLNAFPLFSSFTGVKVTEVMEDETTDSPHGTPTLLQIGTLEATQKSTHNTQNTADNLTPSIMNLDSFNFFSNNLYQNFDSIVATTANTAVTQPAQSIITTTLTTVAKPSKDVVNVINKTPKVLYNNIGQSTSTTNTNMNNVNIGMKSYRNNSIVVDKRQLQGKTPTAATNNKHFSYSSHNITVTTTQHQPVYDNSQVINTSTSSSRAVVSSGINFNSTNRYNEYNTFNPFELPKTTQSFVKNYNEPSYASSNCNYNYQTADYNYQLGKNNYYEGNNCNFYNTGNTTANNNSLSTNHTSQNINNTNNASKKTKESSKTMVNWMAPDFSSTTSTHGTPHGANAAGIAKVTSYSDFGQNNYPNTNALYATDYQNANPPTSATTSIMDQEHQFPWSPTKLPQLLDPLAAPNFPPSTLPTLVGDLALGISTYSSTNHQMFDKKAKPPKKQTQTHETAGNFLSVSQLVEHNKDAAIIQSQTQTQSARITNRRNSGSGGATRASKHTVHSNSKSKAQSKRHSKDTDNHRNIKTYELDWDAKRNKNPISNYSAESLIGAKQQNYPKAIPPYLPDNLIPYFPPNIDENFTQANQNYHQTNTFTTNYNNTFIPPPTSTTYLPTSNFMPDMFDNPIENIFSHSNPTKSTNTSSSLSGNNKKSPQKVAKDNQYLLTAGQSGGTPTKSKTKKKDTFVDLSFLSMPSMNSPLLPDDYHTNFLPPPPPPPNPNQLYSSCKNPLYKQTSGSDLGILPLPTGSASTTTGPVNRTIVSGIQHPDISPAPSSLTNFNLCTIFPEINRTTSVVPDMFRNFNNSSSQNKTTNYLPNLE